MEAYIENLKSVVLFNGMSSEDIMKVLRCLDYYEKSYEKGDFIILQGEAIKEIGIIVEGEILVNKDMPDGNYITVNVLKENQTFGEDIVYSGAGNSFYTLIAKKPTRVIYINGNKISSEESTSCKYRSRVNLNMLKRLAQNSVFINKQLNYLGIVSLKKRVATFLLDMYEENKSHEFLIDMNREQMSNFLNGTRPAVSKILIKFKDQGMISYKKNKFEIKDLKKLLEEVNWYRAVKFTSTIWKKKTLN